MVKVKGQSTNVNKNIETAIKPQNKTLQQAIKNRKIMPALNAIERFVESISQGNDSGNFDASFEIKHILSPKADEEPSAKCIVRHGCVTELDRERIEKFVQDFEQRQYRNNCDKNNNNNNNENNAINMTPKSSPYLYRKAKSIYQNSWIASRSSSPRSYTPTDQLSGEQNTTEPIEFQRNSLPERISYRSAAKMLQFFAAKKTKSPNKQILNHIDLDNASQTSSPILRRKTAALSDCEQDDGMDSQGNSSQHTSNSSDYSNTSPDSSFVEMHPPLLPVFKVTPPANSRQKNNRNPAYEFARFLRGSFHAKRANITILRRSLSDVQNFDNIDFTKPQTPIKGKKVTNTTSASTALSLTTPKANFISKATVNILSDTNNNNQQVKQQRQPMPPKVNSLRVSHF